MNVPLAFRFALRELRGGLSGFAVFLLCIALGVAAISGVNAVALSINSGIAQEGRALLGGDVSFSTEQRELTASETAFVAGLGPVSRVATTRSMARLPDGSDQSLVELKAVDGTYPMVGQLVVDPPDATARMKRGEGVLVDPILLERLQLSIGDELALGAATLPVLGTITEEPDRVGDGFLFGPRLMLNFDALGKTQLVQPGSLVEYATKVALADPSAAALETVAAQAGAQFPEAGWRVRSRENAAPALTRNVTRFSQFLTLVGLTALIVGGVGVANAVRAFLEAKRPVIASFKALGAPASFVFLVYLIQIMLLALVGIALGLLLGGLMPFIARWALEGILPVGNASAFHPAALVSAIGYGLLTALAFALWPLGQTLDVPATALFRNASREDAGWPRRAIILATALVVAALVSLAIWQAGDRRIALTFVGGIAVSFVLLRGVAFAIAKAAKASPTVRSTPLRLAIGNIHRPGALTPSVVLSLGLGLALLVSLATIDGNLRNQISANIPKDAPDFFFVDIQQAQFEPFTTALRIAAPDGKVQTTPMLRGRVVALNDVPAAQVKVKPGGEWVLRGDRGVTYAETLPPNATLEAGEWWAADYSGPPLVSFAAEEADEVGVEVGDTITVNVLGRDITATVANLRNVEWESMSINFVMVFSPNTFAGAPHAYMATLRVGETTSIASDETAEITTRDATILRELTNAFPTITTVRVRDALTTVNGLIGQLATAIRAAALLALAASVLVLAGALAAGNRARVHDSVVLKTLGATRRTLISAYVTEYALLGLATAVFALAAGTLAAWFVVAGIMGFSFTVLWPVALATVGGALALTVGFGLVGTWRVLGQKAAPVLREL